MNEREDPIIDELVQSQYFVKNLEEQQNSKPTEFGVWPGK